ncbi:MAG TPA: guanine deaminase [Solirubrobacteraceae bacterium]|nr:guanine deaminase [Solirubrobacteraceae bacterium]
MIYRGRVLDTPEDPFHGGALRVESDAGLFVSADGQIADRGAYQQVRARHPQEPVRDLAGGLLLPGFVDTHVHFPQARIIGALGMPLLEWLERCALPEEARLADVAYARAVASEFVGALVDAGTTTALVFGAHFAPAVDSLFEAAAGLGLRVTSGLVVSDRLVPHELRTTAQRAYDEGLALATRWHGTGRNRYAAMPRFALSCSDELLASCSALQQAVPGSWLTSHLNENVAEIEQVRELCGGSYVDSYDRHGLVGPRSVFAHNVHPESAELARLADARAAVAHCPTSNAALGSGLFPLARHLAHGVPVALGCDVGAGTGYSLFKEGLQAYFAQRQRGADGVALSASQLLYLATAAGAGALGLQDRVGDLSVGKAFDALWLRPPPGSPLAIALRHSDTDEQALARAFALATSYDVAGVWIGGAETKPVSATDSAAVRLLP